MALTPMTREEVLLDAIAEGSEVMLEPMTREEMWLNALITGDAQNLSPMTRKELLYQKIFNNGTVVKDNVLPKDVNFIDYDGRLLFSYTAAEFAALTEMPANPHHKGLMSQGWNWTLTDAKAQVASSGFLDIGQMYVTDDGKTRIYVDMSPGFLSPRMYIGVNGTLKIDWGDGSNVDTLTSNSDTTLYKDHTYAKPGRYVITLEVVSGSATISGSGTSSALLKSTSATASDSYGYSACIRKVEIGSNMGIGLAAFGSCFRNESITIPLSVTAFGNYAFYANKSLKSLTLPKDATAFGDNHCHDCNSMHSISVPKNYAPSASAYRTCNSLRRIVVPTGTSVPSQAFYQALCIEKISIPASVTSIASQAFYGAYSVGEYHFKATTPPTINNANAFTGINANCKIYVPTASVDAYKTAWSTHASKIVGE